MNDLRFTEYNYGVFHNAPLDQGTSIEIPGLLTPATLCIGPMYIDHIARVKDHTLHLPKAYVGETNCENETLKFYMD